MTSRNTNSPARNIRTQAEQARPTGSNPQPTVRNPLAVNPDGNNHLGQIPIAEVPTGGAVVGGYYFGPYFTARSGGCHGRMAEPFGRHHGGDFGARPCRQKRPQSLARFAHAPALAPLAGLRVSTGGCVERHLCHSRSFSRMPFVIPRVVSSSSSELRHGSRQFCIALHLNPLESFPTDGIDASDESAGAFSTSVVIGDEDWLWTYARPNGLRDPLNQVFNLFECWVVLAIQAYLPRCNLLIKIGFRAFPAFAQLKLFPSVCNNPTRKSYYFSCRPHLLDSLRAADHLRQQAGDRIKPWSDVGLVPPPA